VQKITRTKLTIKQNCYANVDQRAQKFLQ